MFYRQLAHVLITIRKIKLLHTFSKYIMLTQYFLHMQFVNRPGKRNILTDKTSNMENVKIRFTPWVHFWILIASNYFIVFQLQKTTDVLSRKLRYRGTGLFISPSGISELDCATTKTDTAEWSISIGRESLPSFFCTRGLGVLPRSTARG